MTDRSSTVKNKDKIGFIEVLDDIADHIIIKRKIYISMHYCTGI